jgi:hypothetical protein
VYLVTEATYKDGVLIPDQPLGDEKEGRRFKIIVVAEEHSAAKRDRFFCFVKSHSFNLPEDFRFNREELIEER